jgi:NOL1/NOP2/fmu family ribosome biogenesis protein
MIRKLKKEEAEALISQIDAQYGSELAIEGTFLSKDEKRESRKIFLYTGDALPDVPAEWTGIHFCTIRDGVVYPSIEGAQGIGKTASKAIELSAEEAEYIMSGRDIELLEEKQAGYYILKAGDDILGIGLVEGKKIINQTPKSRRTRQQFRTI